MLFIILRPNIAYLYPLYTVIRFDKCTAFTRSFLEMLFCQKFCKIWTSFNSSQFISFQNEIGIDGGMVDLPEPVGEVMTLTEKLYVPKKEFPDVSEIRKSNCWLSSLKTPLFSTTSWDAFWDREEWLQNSWNRRLDARSWWGARAPCGTRRRLVKGWRWSHRKCKDHVCVILND